MTEQFWNTGKHFRKAGEYPSDLPPIQVLIDGDIIAYRCSAVTDGKLYTVGGKKFRYMKDAKEYCDKNNILNEEIEAIYEPEPEETALHNSAVIIDTVKNYYTYERKLNPIIKVFLSGSTNFRYKIYPDYKANRKEQRRPKHLEGCKEYLQQQFKAHRYEGYEADDLIGMVTTALRKESQRISIVSNDKDFTQLGGEGVEQYDFTTGKVWEVSEYDAMLYFYKQILMGDKADGVPGLKGVGNQTALKLLKECKEDRDMYNAVVFAYSERLKVDAEEAKKMVDITGKVLYLLREENKLWEPPPPRTG